MKTHTIEHLIDKIQNADNLTDVDRRELSNLLKSQQKASTFYALVHELTEIGEQEMSGDDWKGIFQNCFNKIQ